MYCDGAERDEQPMSKLLPFDRRVGKRFRQEDHLVVSLEQGNDCNVCYFFLTLRCGLEPCACNDKKTPTPSEIGARRKTNGGPTTIGNGRLLEETNITRMGSKVFTTMLQSDIIGRVANGRPSPWVQVRVRMLHTWNDSNSESFQTTVEQDGFEAAKYGYGQHHQSAYHANSFILAAPAILRSAITQHAALPLSRDCGSKVSR